MNTKQERERRKAIWKAAKWSLPIKTNEVEAADIAHALAMEMERRNLAYWQTPPAAPALSDLERAVVDTGLSWERDPGSLDLTQAHIAAVRALRDARGGAP